MSDLELNKRMFGYKTVEFSPALYNSMFDRAMSDGVVDPISMLKTTNHPPVFDEQRIIALLPNVSNAQSLPKYAITYNLVQHKENVQSLFGWQNDYLYALDRNSEGFLIDWANQPFLEIKEFHQLVDDLHTTLPTTLAQYGEYIRPTLKRQKVLMSSLACVVLLFILTLFTKKIVFVVLLLFTASIAFALVFSSLF